MKGTKECGEVVSRSDVRVYADECSGSVLGSRPSNGVALTFPEKDFPGSTERRERDRSSNER